MADTRELIVKFLTEGTEAVQSSVKGLSKSLGGISDYAQSAQAASLKFAAGLGAAGTAAAGFIGVGAKIAGDFEAARSAFIGLLGSVEKADKTMARIKEEAKKTPFELTGLTEATKQLTSVTRDGDKAIDILMNVGKAITASGGGQFELDRVVFNLKQIQGIGKLEAVDLKELRRAIPIFDQLVEAAGTSIEKIQQAKDPAAELFRVFEVGGKNIKAVDQAFELQAGNFNQLVSNMKDAFAITMSDIAVQSGAFDIVKGALKGLISFMDEHRDTIVNVLKNGFEWLKNNAPVVAGVLIGALTPAFVGLAMSIGGVLLTLAPFMIAGALLAPLVMKWVNSVGGAGNAMKILGDKFKQVYNVIKTFISGINFSKISDAILGLASGAINVLVGAVKILVSVFDFLKPSIVALLQAFVPLGQSLVNWFNAVKPELTIIGALVGGVVVGAIWLLINAIRVVVQAFTIWVNFATWLWNTFNSLVGAIGNFIGWIGQLAGKFDFLKAAAAPIITIFDAIKGVVGAVGSMFGSVGGSSDNLAAAQQRLKSSTEALTQSKKDLSTALQDVKDKEMGLEGATLRVERAQRTYTDAVRQYGPNSLEAREAALSLKEAQRDQERATNDLKNANNNLRDANNRVKDAQNQVKNAADGVATANRNAKAPTDNLASSMWGLASSIGSAFASLAKSVAGNAGSAFKAILRAARIPGFQHGGIVPGGPNEAVPILAHGGERIIPRTGVDVNSQGGMSGGITVNFYGDVAMDSDDRVRQLAMEVKRMLDRENKLYNLGAL